MKIAMNKYQEALDYIKENTIILMHKGDDWEKAVDTLQELIYQRTTIVNLCKGYINELGYPLALDVLDELEYTVKGTPFKYEVEDNE